MVEMAEMGIERLKNEEVIDHFLDYYTNAANNNRTLRVVNDKLMSYDLAIAKRFDVFIKVLNPVLAPSQTTKKHINKLLTKGNELNKRMLLASKIE